MKITILIRRLEPDKPRLEAYVIQSGTNRAGEAVQMRGANLLAGGRFTVVDSAIQKCDSLIMAEYKLVDPPEIEYIVEEGAVPE